MNLRRGSALGHTPSRALSYLGVFITSVLIGDKAGQASAAEALQVLVADAKSSYPLAHSPIYSGWVKIEAGSLAEGCRLMSEELAGLDARGFILGQYFYMVLLATGHLRLGKVDDGLNTLKRAEALIEHTGSR
jgi:hypothetical protein